MSNFLNLLLHTRIQFCFIYHLFFNFFKKLKIKNNNEYISSNYHIKLGHNRLFYAPISDAICELDSLKVLDLGFNQLE